MSIVISFNHGKYLRQSIDSAPSQRYAPVEVLVVDDVSTVDSKETIENYGKCMVPVPRDHGGCADGGPGFFRSG